MKDFRAITLTGVEYTRYGEIPKFALPLLSSPKLALPLLSSPKLALPLLSSPKLALLLRSPKLALPALEESKACFACLCFGWRKQLKSLLQTYKGITMSDKGDHQ